MKKVIAAQILVYSLALFICACNPLGPEPINFGKDQCHYCKMTIANPNFGAELITDKGRILKYDAAECMVNHIKEESPEHQSLYVIAYDEPKELYLVDSLYFIISPDFRSPMGANLAAFSTRHVVEPKYQQQLIRWEQLVNKLNK